ncbi:exported hypothetical protein [Candidatus Desulfosporosinus infrequens]|uniref:Uncharacterized protein n=1 Tax=Candidatus Desulfosporosinus infrequens TaxID=2043169 RepID=A0A2U3L3A3_9FIRM|nr:exported hypothetical protein [Candidatus Desulfosporosinus infrequens]
MSIIAPLTVSFLGLFWACFFGAEEVEAAAVVDSVAVAAQAEEEEALETGN